MASPKKPDTIGIHAGQPKPSIMGAVNMPIFQSSTYYHDPDSLSHGVRYHRLNNSPNHIALAEKVAELEHGEDALITSSGMSAITAATLALVGKGLHLLAQKHLYAGAKTFFNNQFQDFGRQVSYFDLDRLDELEKLLKPTTVAIYIESLENPFLRAPHFDRIVAFARQHGLITFIDNTLPSPTNFNPLLHGMDVVIHSATKYMNGHSDIIAGAVIGKKEHILETRNMLNILGGCLDPHSLFLLDRGLKTMGVRVRAHNQNAQRLAEALANMKHIAEVSYPGLPEHPDHRRLQKQFKGFGGMLTFKFNGSLEDLEERLKRLELTFNAPSLGGAESLLTLPAQTSFANFTSEEKKALGVTDTLVRVSVGLEDVEDLIADFTAAFNT